MPLLVGRLCAVWLIVLTLCPFTAPFSTFDPGLFHNETSADQGPLLKPSSAQEKSSALPAFAVLDLQVSDLPTARVGLALDHPVHRPFLSNVLRL